MQEKILSVIIPVYNVQEYLHQCLDSVFSQDLENFEVICVNDGSTDNSRNIIREFEDKHNDLIVVDRANGGLPAARNSGYKVAIGKYIYFLDSDDYLLPSALKQMVDFSEKNKLDIGKFNVEISTGGQYFEVPEKPETVLQGNDFFKFLAKNNYSLPASPVWMYLYNKSFLDNFNISFKEGIVLEDNHYTLRVLLLAQRVHLLNKPIQYHRIQRAGAETHIVSKEQIDSLLITCRDLFMGAGAPLRLRLATTAGDITISPCVGGR